MNKNTWHVLIFYLSGLVCRLAVNTQVLKEHASILVSHNPVGVFEESVLKPWLVMQERLGGEILDERAANLYKNTTYRKAAQAKGSGHV